MSFLLEFSKDQVFINVSEKYPVNFEFKLEFFLQK